MKKNESKFSVRIKKHHSLYILHDICFKYTVVLKYDCIHLLSLSNSKYKYKRMKLKEGAVMK